MKKKILLLFMVLTIVTMLAGCGGTENSENDVSDLNHNAASSEDNAASSDESWIVTAEADENGNYVVNGSFEEADFTGWNVTNIDDVTEELDIYTRDTDCYEGLQSLHFYSGSATVNFTAEQKITGLDEGTYKLTAHIQGEATDYTIYFYAIIDGEEYKVDGSLDGYVNWYTAELPELSVTDGEVTIGMSVYTETGGWGTIDDITLVKE